MHLTRLISYSESRGPMDRKTLQHILVAARDHNMRDEITGILCYSEKYFLQVLEGARELLSRTFQRISANETHQGLVIVSCLPTDARAFPNWWMAYINDAESVAELSIKYSGSSDFRPDLMTADSLLLFATDLGSSIKARSRPKRPEEVVHI
jgi:hypothetical protein